jgi:hypothetical protein|uniref:Uncharacterized protein n=2 Tax=Picea TaxID=3328 RepID=A0A117NG27_PICGL|nr:hypothetical protein ABT39_MTgene1922 [Picea glauca]QHR89909.1 hypothetical protein Q903MT_gene3931 [Picea sitchensis]
MVLHALVDHRIPVEGGSLASLGRMRLSIYIWPVLLETLIDYLYSIMVTLLISPPTSPQNWYFW